MAPCCVNCDDEHGADGQSGGCHCNDLHDADLNRKVPSKIQYRAIKWRHHPQVMGAALNALSS
jgi:hypothetical protein